MKVLKVEFQGYKAFDGDNTPSHFQHLNLAPLTVVLGKNNSGKSAVVRLPRLLLGGLECDDGRVLPVEVRGLNYGSNFLDLVHGGAFFKRPSFRVVAEHQQIQLDVAVTLFSRGALAADEPPSVWAYDMKRPEVISIPAPMSRGNQATQALFNGLLPAEKKWTSWRSAAKAVLDDMVHIGPTRAQILPIYTNESFNGFGPNGAGSPHLLRLDSAIADEVGSWYEQNMEGWRLSLKRDSESFSLRLSRNNMLTTNLAQAGEGLQQVLPVVTHQLWRQRTATGPFLDLIEQPELHLHTAAQAPLADLFIKTASMNRGQLIVETNSEPLLLRLQRRVAEKLLKPEDLSIYFVEMSDAGAKLHPIPVHPDGELDWWPAGVFEEDFAEVAAIRRAQRANGKSA